ncbi:MAG: sugar phosphate isomerase/epimerase [Deltaproteobacteria bacterium]|nr:sugar phosphate isomerase/epimerase [Deltaproteobacteria bacterium]
MQLDFDYLELTLDPPEAHHETVLNRKKEILTALADHGLGLVCHLPTFLYLADLAPRIREASLFEMKGALNTAAALNPRKVVLHPPYIGGLGPLVMDRSRAIAMESLEAVITEAGRLGLCMCIENMFPKYPGWIEPKDFIPVMEKFPSLEMTLDFGHANVDSKRGDRILAFVETFKDRISHIHISDNLGKGDDHLPGERRRPSSRGCRHHRFQKDGKRLIKCTLREKRPVSGGFGRFGFQVQRFTAIVLGSIFRGRRFFRSCSV